MYTFKTDIEANSFDAFVAADPLNNLLQSSKWAQVKSEWGSSRLGVYDTNGQLVAACLVLIRYMGPFKFGYAPRGPIMDYTNKELVSFFLKAIKDYGKKEKWLFFKFDPKLVRRQANLKAFPTSPVLEGSQELVAFLEKNGAKHSGYQLDMGATIQPRFNATTYFQDGPVTGLFDSSVNRLIRRAEARKVSFRRGDKKDIPALMGAIQKTMDRKQIHLRNAAYFELLMDTYGEAAVLTLTELNVEEARREWEVNLLEIDETLKGLVKAPKKARALEEQKQIAEKMMAELDTLTAGRQEQVLTLSACISIVFGDTLEMLYAGFDSDFKNYYPQYLLYAETMEMARNMGFKKTCMGGVEGDLKDGLTMFKSNFNPQFEEYLGEFTIPTSFLYGPAQLALSLRAKLKQMKKHKNEQKKEG